MTLPYFFLNSFGSDPLGMTKVGRPDMVVHTSPPISKKICKEQWPLYPTSYESVNNLWCISLIPAIWLDWICMHITLTHQNVIDFWAVAMWNGSKIYDNNVKYLTFISKMSKKHCQKHRCQLTSKCNVICENPSHVAKGETAK